MQGLISCLVILPGLLFVVYVVQGISERLNDMQKDIQKLKEKLGVE